MIYNVEATNIKLLAKKVEAVIEIFKKNKGKYWQYITEQSVESIVEHAQLNKNGNYSATIYFSQKPIFQYNYHGILADFEQLENQNYKAM